ncbi:oogenesin-1-like [Mastomys coucha]|uniref:oogenesin-1-like n=1 Tax=Mastomys coucha TaxID=35658 RepID=UPI0012624D5A|nr:oogenesin-1-like [Mastomys coucha]
MDNDSLPTLIQYAIKSLLKDEALAISALKEVPSHLFPEMFKGAFTERCTKVVTAMVSAWPFPLLPVGTLMEDRHLETLKALLDGLNVLVTGKVHSRYKLRVLDLRRNVHHDFWSIQAGSHEDNCSPENVAQKQPLKTCSSPQRKKHLKVVIDCVLKTAYFDEWTTYLLQWVQERKSSIHLCCRKLHSCTSSVSNVIKVFELVDLNCILELRLSHWWLEFLVELVPYLEQMSNLHTLMLEGIKKPFSFIVSEDQEEEWQSTLLSLLSNLDCLQNLYLNDIYLLEGSLDKWLSCLKTPLETLSITYCPRLIQSDFEYLPHCLNIRKLKHLNLNGLFLSDIGYELPGHILEKVTSTLQILELERCGMTDSHFEPLLPALSQCSQLLKVNFNHNNISLPVLKNLLCHTAKLSQLTEELYPAPQECYEGPTILTERFKQLCPELLEILRAQRQPKKVSISTRNCWCCLHSNQYYYNLETTDWLFQCICLHTHSQEVLENVDGGMGAQENYSEFVACLLEAAERSLGPGQNEDKLLNQLAYENANSASKAALRGKYKGKDLDEMVQLCREVDLFTHKVTQAINLAVGATVKAPPSNQSCFRCGQAYLTGNWSGSFDDLMQKLRMAIVTINSTRVDISMAEELTMWIHQAMIRLKEWAGIGVLAVALADKITWKSDSHVWIDQWPLPTKKLAAAMQLVQEQLSAGHIEPSTSPWNTPIFVIQKKRGKWRLLQDLRKINKTMVPMGAIQPGLPSPVAIPKGFSKIVIDLKDCFFCIPLHPEDCKRFAFSLPVVNCVGPSPRFQLRVLPQGMANSPTLCQKYVAQAMDPIHLEYPNFYIIHYMDDILLAGADSHKLLQVT